MGLVTGFLLALAGVAVGIAAYAVACAGFLLYVRLPHDGSVAVLEDLAFVLALPFVVAVVVLPTVRN